MERHPHELAIHDEVEGLRLVVRLGGEEEAVDDLGEAHAGELGGDRDGGGRRAERRRQLRDEAHAHLARRLGVHGGGGGSGGSGGRDAGAAAGRVWGGFWDLKGGLRPS